MNFLQKYWPLIVLFIAGYFTLALHLDNRPMVMWDESRNAVNAMEMVETGHPMVRYFQGRPDDWELKPPMLTWLQATSMGIFGYNTFAVRFPVLIFAFLTLIIMYHWFTRVAKSRGSGLLAGLVLMTSAGYAGLHVARTGDHDTVLAFFMLLQLIFLFEAVENPATRNRSILFFTLALIFSVLTKSIAGLFFLPGILIWLISVREFRYVVLRPFTIAMFLLVIGVVGVYYLIRENLQSGYLSLVWEGEIWPKFSNSNGGHDLHQESIFFYVLNLFRERFYPWLYFLPVSIWLIINRGTTPEKRFFGLVLSAGLPMLVVISLGTAAFWYDAPLLPLLSMTVGAGLYHLAVSLSPGPGRRFRPAPGFFTILFLIAILTPPLVSAVDRALHKGEVWMDEKYGVSMEAVEKEFPEMHNYQVLHNGYNAVIVFYTEMRAFTQGANAQWIEHTRNLPSVDTILTCQAHQIDSLNRRFSCDTLWEKEGCYLVSIRAKRIRTVTPPNGSVVHPQTADAPSSENPSWKSSNYSPIIPERRESGWTFPFPIRN